MIAEKQLFDLTSIEGEVDEIAPDDMIDILTENFAEGRRTAVYWSDRQKNEFSLL